MGLQSDPYEILLILYYYYYYLCPDAIQKEGEVNVSMK